MQTQEVAIKPNLKVVLRSDAQQIDEVVVTAMGIKRSEKALGYAATSVGGEKIAESRTSDVMSSLAGKIAGVQISSTSSDPEPLIRSLSVELAHSPVPTNHYMSWMEYL